MYDINFRSNVFWITILEAIATYNYKMFKSINGVIDFFFLKNNNVPNGILTIWENNNIIIAVNHNTLFLP